MGWGREWGKGCWLKQRDERAASRAQAMTASHQLTVPCCWGGGRKLTYRTINLIVLGVRIDGNPLSAETRSHPIKGGRGELGGVVIGSVHRGLA